MSIQKVYTKTGDKGETGLYNGRRLSKNNEVFKILGTIDELNACLGMVLGDMNYVLYRRHISFIKNIQKDLISLGSYIGSEGKIYLVLNVKKLESEQDYISSRLPVIRTFIKPETASSSKVHLCRTVCRKLERKLIYTKENESINKYINRLSDYLFQLARITEYIEIGIKYIKYIGIILFFIILNK